MKKNKKRIIKINKLIFKLVEDRKISEDKFSIYSNEIDQAEFDLNQIEEYLITTLNHLKKNND